MKAAEHKPFQSIDFPDRSLADMLCYLLENLTEEVGADCTCVFGLRDEPRQTELLAAFPRDPGEAIVHIIETVWSAEVDAAFLDEAVLAGTGYGSGMIWRMSHAEQTFGALVILSHLPGIRLTLDHKRVNYCVSIARALLQNQRLLEEEAISRTIQEVAAHIGDSFSPQDMVNLVSRHLLSPSVRFCSLLLYGPQNEVQTNGPFSYLELQGSWSRQHGSGVGLGIRIYLDQYTDMLNELDARKVWHIPDVPAMAPRFDGLLRAFIKGTRVNSAVMMTLNADHRRLGVLVIGTQDGAEFTRQELRAWHIVSEFLAMNAMARTLLQQHEFQLRARAALLDSVTDGVVLVLPDANSPHSDGSGANVMTVNQRFSKMFNLKQASAQGLSLPQLLRRMQLPEDVRQQLSYDWLTIPFRDPSTQRSEFSMVHPGGYPAIVEWYSAPLYQDRRVMGRIYIFHDVTEDRSAVSLRANFISRMSHELRTPLTSIKGFAQFLAEELRDQLSPMAQEYASIIFDNATHLNLLFTNIIEITRADTGEMNLNLSDTNLTELVENVMSRFEAQSNASNKWVELAMEPAQPNIHVDANRVSLVLEQLLSNAFKHAPPESTIHIQAQSITQADQLPSDTPAGVVIPCMLVSVIDEGVGLTQDEIELIFLPFFRTQESRTNRLEGTGLGLTTSRSIIELHRGKIWAEARKRGRRGGRFHFTLPTASR